MRFLLREYSRRAADSVKPANMTVSLAKDAPAPLEIEAARFLLKALGDGALWRWLSHRDRAQLRGEITKSFKSAPASLRHGLVKTRFARHLQRHQKDLGSLLKLWAPSQTELLRELRNLSSQNAARVLEESEATPETSAAATDSSAPLTFDFSEENLAPLRQRFDENALQLAQFYLNGAPPGGQFFPEIEPHETASVRGETEVAEMVSGRDETPSGGASARDAMENAALNEGETDAENLGAESRATKNAAPRDQEIASENDHAAASNLIAQVAQENAAPHENATDAENRAAASTRAARNTALHENEIAAENLATANTREARSEAAREILSRQLNAAKTARDAQRQRAREFSAEIGTLKARQQRETHELRAQLVQAQKDAETQREKAAAAQKTLERETRRIKRETAQLETFEAENKSLKRQLRQSQQSVEDARKTAATAATQLQQAQDDNETLQREIDDLRREKTLAAPLASTRQSATRGVKKAVAAPCVKAARVPIGAPKVAPVAPRVLDPLDEVFRWNAASGAFAVTLRETREMISRNDETRVFALSRALETLRESDEKTYFNFLARAREFGAYFRRVLTVSTIRVLVDASNVARIETDRRGRGKLDFLLQAREELRRRDAFPLLLIADASLQHFIDEPAEVAKMATRGELELLPAGNVADDFLAREARRTGAFVLTNDKSFHQQVAPDFEPSRIGFKLHHHFIAIDDF